MGITDLISDILIIQTLLFLLLFILICYVYYLHTKLESKCDDVFSKMIVIINSLRDEQLDKMNKTVYLSCDKKTNSPDEYYPSLIEVSDDDTTDKDMNDEDNNEEEYNDEEDNYEEEEDNDNDCSDGEEGEEPSKKCCFDKSV